VQGRYIFDPPQTRVNAQGFVEDVPAEESAPARALASSAPDEADAIDSIPGDQQGPSVPASAAPGEADSEPAASRPPADPPPSPR
jgi:hypothetical protein